VPARSAPRDAPHSVLCVVNLSASSMLASCAIGVTLTCEKRKAAASATGSNRLVERRLSHAATAPSLAPGVARRCMLTRSAGRASAALARRASAPPVLVSPMAALSASSSITRATAALDHGVSAAVDSSGRRGRLSMSAESSVSCASSAAATASACAVSERRRASATPSRRSTRRETISRWAGVSSERNSVHTPAWPRPRVSVVALPRAPRAERTSFPCAMLASCSESQVASSWTEE
jgi:hypothetical protein